MRKSDTVILKGRVCVTVFKWPKHTHSCWPLWRRDGVWETLPSLLASTEPCAQQLFCLHGDCWATLSGRNYVPAPGMPESSQPWQVCTGRCQTPEPAQRSFHLGSWHLHLLGSLPSVIDSALRLPSRPLFVQRYKLIVLKASCNPPCPLLCSALSL